MNEDLPALLGGPPAFPEGPPRWPRWDPAVEAALESVARSGAWGEYRGEQVPSLERELASFHAVPHVLTCASGTLAVEAALRAVGVGPGDEVILASYEYEPNFLTLHAIEAIPVLVDVSPGNWNLDPGCVEAAITPKTKAILATHLHGGLVPMPEVAAIAARHGVKIVEDAAQAAGAIVSSRGAGTWGDAGVLSFGGSKLLSAGRGGAVLFREPRLFQRARLWLHRGIQPWAPMSELQAAVLRPQLARLHDDTLIRARHVESLRQALHASVPGLEPFENAVPDSSPAYYKLGFRFDSEVFGMNRDTFVKALRAEGVALDAGFQALHIGRSPSRFRVEGELGESERAHRGCVILHHPVLLEAEECVLRVAAAVGKIYRARQDLMKLSS